MLSDWDYAFKRFLPNLASPVSVEGQCACSVSSRANVLIVRFSSSLPCDGVVLNTARWNGQDTHFISWQLLSAIGIESSWKLVAAGREVVDQSELNAVDVRSDLAFLAIPAVSRYKYRKSNLNPSAAESRPSKTACCCRMLTLLGRFSIIALLPCREHASVFGT